METRDIAALTTSGIAALTTAQVQLGLTTDQLVALTTAQIGVLTTDQVVALTTLQVSALETRDVVALKTSQIVSLTTAQVSLGMTTTQLAALTTTQTMVLTSDQLNALGANLSYLTLGTPLVLDLNGDGITTQSILSGVEFDLFASGQKVHTGWVAGGDGLLVMDRNHDGQITDGSELFGSATLLPTGERAANGYIALGSLDTNGDGVITSADSGFTDLQVWADTNSDGVSQSGEMRTLDSLGITKLDLAATTSWENNNGNFEGLVSSYETADGVTHEMADVWFVADKNEYASAEPVASTLPADDLPSKVGGLVQAIGAFNESQSIVASATMPGVDSTPAATTTAGTLSVATDLGGAVDALKQFDPNGQPVLASGSVQSVAAITSLTTPTLASTPSDGILVVGK